MTATDAKLIRGYNRLAGVYRPLEFCLFGNRLQKSRVAMLDRISNVKRALVLGDGDGRLLEQLCASQPNCRITSVDLSEEMLKRQRRRVDRVGANDRVEFLLRDAKAYRPTKESYDLIVAAYFLDCFSESQLRAALPRWLSGIRQGGTFYFVDFVHPPRGWRRCQSQVYQSFMHWLFRWQTGLPNRQLVDLDAVLNRCDLHLVDSETGVHPMMTSRIYRTGGTLTSHSLIEI